MKQSGRRSQWEITHAVYFYSVQVYTPDLQSAVCVLQNGLVPVHLAVASGHDTLFVPLHHSLPSNQPVKSFKIHNYD